MDANQVLAARTHGRDWHVFCRVVGRGPVHQEPLVGGRYLERPVFTRAPLARFVGIGGVALYLVGVLYREATGLVVGGYDHERVGIVRREGFPNLDGLVGLLPGLYHELRVALVAISSMPSSSTIRKKPSGSCERISMAFCVISDRETGGS